MVIVEGDLWSEIGKANLILVTTNAVLTNTGALVMGRGAAKEAKLRCPGIDAVFGEVLRGNGLANHRYGLLMDDECVIGSTWIGAFQTKYHWRDAARLDLIEFSCSRLKVIAENLERIAVNYPGVGNGYLDERSVQPILEGADLPDHVFFYRYPTPTRG